MDAITTDIAALSKPELLRLVGVLKRRTLSRLTAADILSVQWEEASDQAQAALDASIALTPKVRQTHDAAMAACRNYGTVVATGGRKARDAEKVMKAAMAANDAIQTEKDKAWAAYERHDRRANRLWKQLEAEREKETATAHDQGEF